MKRLFILTLAAFLAVSLCACETSTDQPSETTTAVNTTTTEVGTTTATTTTKPEETSTVIIEATTTTKPEESTTVITESPSKIPADYRITVPDGILYIFDDENLTLTLPQFYNMLEFEMGIETCDECLSASFYSEGVEVAEKNGPIMLGMKIKIFYDGEFFKEYIVADFIQFPDSYDS